MAFIESGRNKAHFRDLVGKNQLIEITRGNSLIVPFSSLKDSNRMSQN